MRILKSIFILSLIVITTSCNKNNDDGDSPNDAAFQMDVDGETVTFDANFVIAQMTNQGRFIAVTAVDPSAMKGGAVGIGSIDDKADPLAEGAYNTSDTNNTQISYTLDGNIFGSFGDGGSGTVIITSLDTGAMTISGTFSGTVTNLDGSITYEITNGVFNIGYIEQ